MKRRAQQAIRAVHLVLARKPLPRKLGIYMHALEREHHGAFRQCIDHFRNEGYRVVGDPSEFVNAAEPSVWLSFDDNYQTWHGSLPMLDELGVSATFYVNTAPMRDRADETEIASYFDRISYDGPRVTLSSDELLELSQAGHVIGSHTHTHRDLASLSRREAVEEIVRNRRELEEIVGHSVVDFSWPFGFRRHRPDWLPSWCLENGFRSVAAATPGLQHMEQQLEELQRTPWRFGRGLSGNVQDLSVDGRFFARITGRSAVG